MWCSPYLSLPKVNSGMGYCFILLHPQRLKWISSSSLSSGYTLWRQEVCSSAIRNTFSVIVAVCLRTLTQLSSGAWRIRPRFDPVCYSFVRTVLSLSATAEHDEWAEWSVKAVFSLITLRCLIRARVSALAPSLSLSAAWSCDSQSAEEEP